MKIGVIGLGYVGSPLFNELLEWHDVTGYDISAEACIRFQNSHTVHVVVENSPFVLADREVVIVCVPTDVNEDMTPDLRPLIDAFQTISAHCSPDVLVVNESTVAPGMTLELAEKYLEGRRVAMCPERINPGDKEHTIVNTTKIIGCDRDDQATLSNVYSFCDELYFCTIREAEAIKIIENTQRDVNIAFMNEMEQYLFENNIDAHRVFKGMKTKWNALNFHPGLVGGHCIAVDPWYLMSREGNFHITKAARDTNTNAIREMALRIHLDSDGEIILLGETYKPNIPDTRTSATHKLKEWLAKWGREVYIVDPVTGKDETEGRSITNPYFVACVGHDCFKNLGVNANLTNLDLKCDWRMG